MSTLRRNRGLGLVELMIAMLAGLVVIGGALAAHLAARAAQAAEESNARLQENARLALNVIAQDLRMAGYWGLTNRADLLALNSASVFPTACGAGWVTAASRAVDGYDGAYGAGCAASGGGAAPGSDVLIVRHASARRLTQSAIIAASDRNRVLVVSSRTRGELFVPLNTGNALPPGYATSDPAGAPPLADTRALAVNAYYVSRNSSVATGFPALRRKTLVAGPAIGDEEIVPGIEDLQVQFGVDTDDDSSADTLAAPGAVPASGTVVSARVWLRVRAEDAEPRFVDTAAYPYAGTTFTPPADHHRRLLVSSTLQLRNLAR